MSYTPKLYEGPLTEVVRIHPSVKADLEYLGKKLGIQSKRGNEGHIIDILVKLCKEKKNRNSAFLEESQNPKLNEGAIEVERDEYKSLYEDAISCSTNYRKRVEKLANMLGISYTDAMNIELDAPIQQQ
jgi:hypothetical protein